MAFFFFQKAPISVIINLIGVKNKHYKHIIEILSERKFATREELVKFMKLQSGGGITIVVILIKSLRERIYLMQPIGRQLRN